MATQRRRSSLAAVLSLAIVLLAAGAYAQIPYCNVTKIEAKRLSNGVQVTVQADGIMNLQTSMSDFFDMEAMSLGKWDQMSKYLNVLPFKITNARSKVGSFAEIGTYPVSHAEIVVPPDARDGVGLNLRVVLYTYARVSYISQGEWGNELEAYVAWGPAVRIQMSPDRRSVVLTITSDQPTIAPAVLRKAPPGGPVRLEVTGDNKRVSVDALNADFRTLMKEFSRKTGKIVAVETGIDRSVSMNLPDMDVDDSLEAIVTGYGLSLKKQGAAALIGASTVASEPAYENSVLETVPLNNIEPVTARNSFPDFVLKHVQISEGQNALTLYGPKSLVDKLRKDLEKLDSCSKKIEVEAMIVEYTSQDDLQTLFSGIAASGSNNLTWDTSKGNLSYWGTGSWTSEFTSSLRALIQAGKISVKARPKTVAVSGKPSSLFVGQERQVQIGYYDNMQGAFTTTILSVALGVGLEATAWCAGDEIRLKVSPKISSVAELEPGTGLPTVSTRQFTSTLLVHSGDTVLIGGLEMAQDNKGRVSGMPQLSKTTDRLAMFVTARVVSDDTPLSVSKAKVVRP